MTDTMTSDNYDETADIVFGGDISLDIGAANYDAAMRENDPGERARLFQQAARWYERSANIGNAQAATNLGYVYLYGRIGSVDDAQAFHWFTLGAEMDNPESCYKLGDLYRSGRGCARDPQKAVELYCRAGYFAGNECDPDNPQGAAVLASIELRLAECCERGEGEHENRKLAHWYYRHAVAHFEVALSGGLNWYGKALENARAGYTRTGEGLQEGVE